MARLTERRAPCKGRRRRCREGFWNRSDHGSDEFSGDFNDARIFRARSRIFLAAVVSLIASARMTRANRTISLACWMCTRDSAIIFRAVILAGWTPASTSGGMALPRERILIEEEPTEDKRAIRNISNGMPG